MANSNTPFGFRPVKMADGRPVPFNCFAEYTIASTYGTAIGEGDPVKSTGTGTNKRSGIELSAAGNTSRGVFKGVSYVNSQGQPVYRNYWAASTVGTDIRAEVYDHPDTIFEIQSDSDSATPAAGDVGNKADMIAGTANATTGISTYQLDTSNIGTGDNLLILQFSPAEDNEVGAYAKMWVIFKEHELRGTPTAV